MSTEVAVDVAVAPEKKVLRIKKNTKTPVVPEMNPSGEVSTVPKTPSKKTKSTTANIDEMLTAIQTHFKLPEKDFKEVVSAFVSKTSHWNKKNKKRRAEGEPSKPKSAYIFFTMKTRTSVSEQMIKETGSAPFTEVTVRLGKLWKELTDKAEFDQQAKEDKERYQKEHDAYVASKPVETPSVSASKPKRVRKAPAAPVEGSDSAPVEAKVKKPRKKTAEVVEGSATATV